MNVFYLISLPAWVIIIITAAARLHDLGAGHKAARWHVRRAGLSGVACVAAIMLATPFTENHWVYAEATWQTAMIAWSWSAVWLTTEGMPPWWDYILGVHRATDEWKGMTFRARIGFELRALAASFRARRNRPVERYSGPERRGRPRVGTDPDQDFPRPGEC